MSEYEKEFTDSVAVLDDHLRRTNGPRQRAILLNYIRHGYLEVAGRYEEIFAPDMMVPHPVYHLVVGGRTVVLDGLDHVRGFYNAVISTRIAMWGIDEKLAVADWGFAGELTFHSMLPGAALAVEGQEVDDPQAIYVRSSRMAFVWPYTENALLIGEHIYEDLSTREVRKLSPGQEISRERVKQLCGEILQRYDDDFASSRAALAAST